MGFHRKYLFKYISIIHYVLKTCFTRSKSPLILKTLLNDLKVKILYGSQISFKCVPDNILEKLVTQCYGNELILKHCLQIEKCLFVSQETLNKFKLNNMQWVLVNAMAEDVCSLPVLHYNKIIVLNSYKESECLLTYTNLFNLCNSNNTCHVLMLRIIKPLMDYKPKITKKVSISVTKQLVFNDHSQMLLDRALYNYFCLPKFVSIGNIVKLDLNKCYPETEYLVKPSNTSITYIKIVQLEGQNRLLRFYNCKSSFYVSSLHTKMSEVKCLTNTYLPIETELPIFNLENLNVNNFNDYILNAFPGGMNGKGESLISWIKPFIHQKNKNFHSLKPIFLVYGPNGCGKNILIKSVSKYLGLQHILQCCFEWPTNNITQFKKKIEFFFDNIRKMTPCLLQLENVEALCLSSTKDIEQELLDIFMKQLSIKTVEPIVIVASTTSKEELSPGFLRLFLQSQKIGSLNKNERKDLFKWILQKNSIAIDSSVIKNVIDHTSGYNYKNFTRLLLLSSKHHFCMNKKSTKIILSESDLMHSIDKINIMFSKSIGAPKVQTVKWDDVGGLFDVKKEIISSLKPSTLTMRRSGILLYGPPGTGKTLLAKAVATECNYNFLSIKGPELFNMYIGQSEANVREVFSKARSAAPCILFFDELDSLAPKRGQNGDSGGVGDRVVSQLLTEMDGMASENQLIFILGATNRPDLIDSALLRPGRLDKSIYVGGCDTKESKLQVLKALTKKFTLDSNINLEDIIDLLPNEVTGAELYGMCHNAWLNSARRIVHQRIAHDNDKSFVKYSNLMVTENDFMEALNENFTQK